MRNSYKLNTTNHKNKITNYLNMKLVPQSNRYKISEKHNLLVKKLKKFVVRNY
jgi:hypothetical protein